MIRFILCCVFSFVLALTVQAQAVRRYHQTLSLQNTQALQLEAHGEVELVKWGGSDILIEVIVTSNNGSTAVLNLLQKEGRYDLSLATENEVTSVAPKMLKRQSIKVKGNDLHENVHYKISVPEQLVVQTTENSYTAGK